MELRITELLDEYREEDTLLQYVEVPDEGRIWQVTKKRMQKKHLRPLRMGLMAAVVAILMMGTVAGVYVSRHWDGILEEFFGATEGQKEVVDDALLDVYATEEKDGCTFTVTQVLGDTQCVLIALDVTLPEEQKLNTLTQEQLQDIAEIMGMFWREEDSDSWDMEWWLQHYFGYWEEDGIYSYGIQLDVQGCSIQSVTDDGATIQCSLGSEGTGHMASAGGEGSFAAGIVHRSIDVEQNKVTLLFYFQSDEDLTGSNCTLRLDHLWMEDLGTMLSNSDGETEKTDLLTEPVELNFQLNYEAQSREYEIWQNGQEIGSVTLSAFSAQFKFPQEPDDPTRLAPNYVDYLGRSPEVSVKMKDGTLIPLKERSSGFAEEQFGFFTSEEIIDLSQVDTLVLNDYTFVMK